MPASKLSSLAQDGDDIFKGIDDVGSDPAFEMLLHGSHPSPLSQEQEGDVNVSLSLTPQLAAAVEELAPRGEESPDGRKGRNNFNSRGQQDLRYKFADEQKKLIYRAGIESGLRLTNGSSKLKKLRGPHYICISHYLVGLRQADIALVMHKSISWVSHTLLDPLAQAEMKRRSILMDANLFSLHGNVVDVLRTALLNDKEPAIQLRATEQWFKVHGRFSTDAQAPALTAGDIVSDVFKRQDARMAQAQKQELTVHVHIGDTEKTTVFPSIEQVEDGQP